MDPEADRLVSTLEEEQELQKELERLNAQSYVCSGCGRTFGRYDYGKTTTAGKLCRLCTGPAPGAPRNRADRRQQGHRGGPHPRDCFCPLCAQASVRRTLAQPGDGGET